MSDEQARLLAANRLLEADRDACVRVLRLLLGNARAIGLLSTSPDDERAVERVARILADE